MRTMKQIILYPHCFLNHTITNSSDSHHVYLCKSLLAMFIYCKIKQLLKYLFNFFSLIFKHNSRQKKHNYIKERQFGYQHFLSRFLGNFLNFISLSFYIYKMQLSNTSVAGIQTIRPIHDVIATRVKQFLERQKRITLVFRETGFWVLNLPV